MTGTATIDDGRPATTAKSARSGASAVRVPMIRPLRRHYFVWGGKARAVCELSQQTQVFRATPAPVELLHRSSGRIRQDVFGKSSLKKNGAQRSSLHARVTHFLIDVRRCKSDQRHYAQMMEKHSVALSAASQPKKIGLADWQVSFRGTLRSQRRASPSTNANNLVTHLLLTEPLAIVPSGERLVICSGCSARVKINRKIHRLIALSASSARATGGDSPLAVTSRSPANHYLARVRSRA